MAKRFIALFLPLAIGLSAQAAETLQTKGNLAAFYSLTTSGCIATNRFVLVADESYRTDGGGGDARRTLYVTEYDHDLCLGREVRSATGFKDLERSELMMSTGAARVMTSIEMRGTVGVELRNVDLTWSATDKTWSGAYTTQYEGPGFMVLTRYNGSSRNAVVNGTLGNEAVSTAGAMDVVKTGAVTITKK